MFDISVAIFNFIDGLRNFNLDFNYNKVELYETGLIYGEEKSKKKLWCAGQGYIMPNKRCKIEISYFKLNTWANRFERTN